MDEDQGSGIEDDRQDVGRLKAGEAAGVKALKADAGAAVLEVLEERTGQYEPAEDEEELNAAGQMLQLRTEGDIADRDGQAGVRVYGLAEDVGQENGSDGDEAEAVDLGKPCAA